MIMLDVYVCEDVMIQREKLQEIARNTIMIEDLDMQMALVSENPHEILEMVKQTGNAGIYFLDIDLQTDLNGLELAKKIRKYDPRGFIIFITTHSEMSYMTFTYKLEAMDFILKDASSSEIRSRVRECILEADKRFRSKNNHAQERFTMKAGERKLSVNYDDIMFFETSSNAHKVILHCTNRILEFYGQIRELDGELDERFYKCHRSFLVNTENISEIDFENKVIRMKNGEECYMSSRLMKGLR